MVALSCAPRGVGSVDLYGFNWKAQGQEVFRHNLLAERSFADVLDGAGHVTIHGTPCSHQRCVCMCIIRTHLRDTPMLSHALTQQHFLHQPYKVCVVGA